MGVVEWQCFGVEVVSRSVFVDFENVEDGKCEWEDTVDLLCLRREKTGMRDRRLDATLMDWEAENLCAFANVDIIPWRFVQPTMGWGGRVECLFIYSNAVHCRNNGRRGCGHLSCSGGVFGYQLSPSYIRMDPSGPRRLECKRPG